MCFTKFLDEWEPPLDFFTTTPPYTMTPFSDAYRLFTPLLDIVSSERGDAVVETLGVNSYFVRNAPRRFTATVSRQQAELVRLVEQLRCQKELGAFFLDAEGVLWGMRTGAGLAFRPARINPQTLQVRNELASADTVFKTIFSFELFFTESDADLVPVQENKDLLGYRAPIGIYVSAAIVAGELRMDVYSKFAQGAGSIVINIENITPAPELYDAPVGGTLVGTFTWVAAGRYQITPAPVSGTYYVQFSPTASPSGFDYYNEGKRFKIVV